MRPKFPDDKTNLGAMKSYCAKMRKIHSDRFEVIRIPGGFTVAQDIPGTGPIVVDGVTCEIV